MSENKLQIAKNLIQQKRYAEARNILKKLDDPTAKRWIVKLDEIDPPRKNTFPIIYVLGLFITLIFGIGIGILLLNRPINNITPSSASVASIPTLMSIPTETATLISTSTFTLEPTSTLTATFTPTLTLTPEPSQTPTSTDTPIPTSTPTITSSPTITVTPFPTRTPLPTRTRIPPTPLPSPIPPQEAQIGPIYDSLYDETYNVDMVLYSTEFLTNSGYMQPSYGNIYVVAHVEVRNLGPGTLRSLYSTNFQLKDGNRAVRTSSFFVSNCDFPLVDLPSGGSVAGCIAFEAPLTGNLEIIYAPFQYEGLQPGRYISFRVR